MHALRQLFMLSLEQSFDNVIIFRCYVFDAETIYIFYNNNNNQRRQSNNCYNRFILLNSAI